MQIGVYDMSIRYHDDWLLQHTTGIRPFLWYDGWNEIRKFIEASPAGSVTMTDEDESPKRIFIKLNDKVLDKRLLYKTEK